MISAIKTVFLVEHCVDLRKSFDGLLQEAELLDINVWNGNAAVFVSRNKRLIKVLWADRTGLRLSMKRFHRECARTKIHFLDERDAKEISEAELFLLLEGKDYEIKRGTREWKPGDSDD